MVIDEIHLLGEDRGPVLEVIVSRAAFIKSHTQRNLRIVGLSTALANAQVRGVAFRSSVSLRRGHFRFRVSPGFFRGLSRSTGAIEVCGFGNLASWPN